MESTQPQHPVPSHSSTHPLTVVRLEVDAFKRLRAARLTPTPTGLVPVRGRNAAGKSSLIEGMEAALCGSHAVQELPIAEGAHGARVVVDMGDVVVRRVWKRDAAGVATSRLVVENAAGLPMKSPQAVLDALRGRFVDPVEFLGMTPPEQVHAVLCALGLDEEVRQLEAAVEERYVRRRDLGRDADRARKTVEQLEQEAGFFQDETLDDVADVGALAAKMKVAQDHNAAIAAAELARSSAASRGAAAIARMKRLKDELAKAEEDEQREAAAWRAANHALVVAGVPIDVAPILAKMREVEAGQRRRAKIEVLQNARAEAASAAALHDAASEDVDEARAQVAVLLAGAAFPVDGMNYDPDAKMLKVHGIPFSQASHAERLKISVAIAMSGNPTIRVVFIRDGSMLDDDSLALVAAMAEERGFQVWCEIVDSQKDGAGVWIEDGEASQPELELDASRQEQVEHSSVVDHHGPSAQVAN